MLGKNHEVIMVIFLYELGKMLEAKAVARSRNSVSELMNIKEESSNLKVNNKIKKVTLNLTNNLELIVNINDKNNVIEYKDTTTNGTITYNKENNNIIVKLFDNNYNAIDLDMTLKSDRQVIKYGIYNKL